MDPAIRARKALEVILITTSPFPKANFRTDENYIFSYHLESRTTSFKEAAEKLGLSISSIRRAKVFVKNYEKENEAKEIR